MTYLIRTASTDDAESIYRLIKYYAEKGVILERPMDDILENINNFLVAVSNERIIGSITHYDYGTNLKEVRSLAVDESFHSMGIGKKLLEELIRRMRTENEGKIFTLTYRPDFFEKNGFTAVPKDDFPEKIWKDCDKCKDKDKCGETALVYID
jgi:amino-acid N-acetyltransferase